MPMLSDAGIQLVNQLSQRHGVSPDAVTHMLIAIQNGNGSMAQFNHSEFGGAGQWMQGGMTMVSDLFNNQLKYQVDSICSDIANELNNNQLTPFSGSFQSQSQNGASSQMQAAGGQGSANHLFVPDPEANWWAQHMGVPNAVGSQNHVKYAYFAQSRRLAVKTGTDIWVYDTLDHQIGGFSQQQGVGGSITFSSQYGIVNLGTLPVVSQNGIAQPIQPPIPQPPMSATNCNDNAAVSNCDSTSLNHQNVDSFVAEDVQVPLNTSDSIVHQAENSQPAASIIETLERLGGLRDKGYVSDEEFASKKAELLKRL